MSFKSQFGSWITGISAALVALFLLGGAADQPAGSTAYVVYLCLVFLLVGIIFRLIYKAQSGDPPVLGWVIEEEPLSDEEPEEIYALRPNIFTVLFVGVFMLAVPAVLIDISWVIAPAGVAALVWMVYAWNKDKAANAPAH